MLLEVADAFQQSQDGAAKAAVAHELFGEAGAKLIPLLDKGRFGIQDYADEAEKLGGVLSDDTIKQLASLKERTDEATARWDAMALHAKAQLIPAIEAITGAFSDNAALGPIVDDFYAGVLDTFRSVVTAGATVVTGLRQVGTTLNMISQMANDTGAGNWSAVVEDAKKGYAELKQEGDSYVEFTTKLWSDQKSLATPHIGPTGDKQISYAKGEKTPKVDESGLNEQIAELNTQLKSLDEARKEHLQNLKGDFDKGLLDYRDYYTQAITLNEQYYQQEEAVQSQRLELAKQKKNIAAAQSAQQELDRIHAERLASEAKLSDALGKEWEKRYNDTKKYATQELAATDALKKSLAASEATQFMTSQQKTDYSGELRIQQAYYKELDKLKEQYDSKKLDEDTYRERLQIAAQAFTDQEQAYRDHLQHEQDIRNSYEDQIKLAMVKIGDSGKTNAQYVGEAFTSVWGTMSSTLDTFVTTGKLSFSQFTESVLADMAKIALHAAEMQIFNSAPSFFSSGGSVGDSSSVPHFATGGAINGPGSGTSDSIPAMLSNGEFVVNAASASKYRSLLESINSGQMSHFATGGAVGTIPASDSGSITNQTSLSLNLHGGSLSPEDLAAIAPQLQAIIDKRINQRFRGQGGLAYQIRYGQV